MIPYVLIRSARRSLAIYIRQGKVEVRAPLQISPAEIEGFLNTKQSWIERKLAQSQQRAAAQANFALQYGDRLRYGGQTFPLLAGSKRRAYFDGAAFYLPASLTAEQIKTHCLRLYRQLARQGLSARLAFYSRLMGVAPQMIRISGAKTRWGSCSARQTISFSWRLIMASAAVQDYVVVHELAHLREMNHSQRFWQIVEDFLPDYPERQRQLRALQRQLTSENWD